MPLPERRPARVRHSRATLTRYGNIAGAVVLYACRRLFEEGGAPDGAPGILAGFGPGITAEMAVGRWVGKPAPTASVRSRTDWVMSAAGALH